MILDNNKGLSNYFIMLSPVIIVILIVSNIVLITNVKDIFRDNIVIETQNTLSNFQKRENQQ